MRPLFSTILSAVPLFALLLLCGCERMVERQDYFPMRDGNTWDYRLLDHKMLKAIAAGQKIETAPPEAEKLPTHKKDEEELTAQTRPSSAGAVASSTPPPNSQGGDLLPTPLTAEPAPAKSGDVAEKAPEAVKSSDLKPARRVTLTLREALDDVTFRSSYGEWDQVWSKKGGYIGLQNAGGRQYLLILPPHTTYRWIATDVSGNNLYFEVEGQVDVGTPAGTFRQCAVSRQESRDKREVFKYWFAPDVGLVRRSKYFAGEEVFRQELVSYKVRPASFETRSGEEKEIREALRGKNRGSEYMDKSDKDKDRNNRELNSVPIGR